MGRKVHPIGFRLGLHQPWSGRWYAEGTEYTNQLHQDMTIRKMIQNAAEKAGVSDVEVERFPGKVRIIVHTAKPGILIGRKGDTVKDPSPGPGEADRQEDRSRDQRDQITGLRCLPCCQ